ncbi:MAG: iron ABC transporter permease [bacterium]
MVKKRFISIIAILSTFVIFVPLFYSLIEAVFENNLLNILLLNERQVILLGKSLVIGVFTGLFSTAIALPLAFLISRTNLPGRKIFNTLFIIPLLIPLYIIALAWININSFFKDFFNIYSLKGVIMVMSFGLFPIAFYLIKTGLDSMDRELEETGILMAGKFEAFRKITFPLIIPSIIVSFVFIFLLAISNFSVPACLQVNVYPVEIFSQVSAFNSFQSAIIMSLPLLFIVFVMIFSLGFLIKRKHFVPVINEKKQGNLINLLKWKYLCFLFCMVFSCLTLFLPVGVLLIKSLTPGAFVFALKTSYPELIRSFVFSVTGACFIVFIGFFIANFRKYVEDKKKNLSETGNLNWNVYLFLLALPVTIVGIALVKFWNRPIFSFFYKSPAIVILAYITMFLPFGSEIIWIGLNQINKSFEEAAFVSGADFGQTLIHILIPLLKPIIKVSWILSFIFCFGELGASLLVTPAGMATLPMRMYNLMHYGSSSLTCALAVIVMLVLLLPALILFNERKII